MELEEVGAAGVVVAGPAELGEALLELGVGADDVVSREVDEDAGARARCSGGAWVGWLFLFKGLPCRIGDQASHAILVKNPHTRHCVCVRERKTERQRDDLWRTDFCTRQIARWCYIYRARATREYVVNVFDVFLPYKAQNNGTTKCIQGFNNSSLLFSFLLILPWI